MQSSAKISISLPSRLLKRTDQKRGQTGETRSQFFRRAAEKRLDAEERRSAVDRYLQGYSEQPESAAEASWLAVAGAVAIAEDPWA